MSGELIVLCLFAVAVPALLWHYRTKPVPSPPKPELTIADVHRELASAMRRIVPTYRMIGAQHVAAIEAIAAWHDQEITRAKVAAEQKAYLQRVDAKRSEAP